MMYNYDIRSYYNYVYNIQINSYAYVFLLWCLQLNSPDVQVTSIVNWETCDLSMVLIAQKDVSTYAVMTDGALSAIKIQIKANLVSAESQHV